MLANFRLDIFFVTDITESVLWLYVSCLYLCYCWHLQLSFPCGHSGCSSAQVNFFNKTWSSNAGAFKREFRHLALKCGFGWFSHKWTARQYISSHLALECVQMEIRQCVSCEDHPQEFILLWLLLCLFCTLIWHCWHANECTSPYTELQLKGGPSV